MTHFRAAIFASSTAAAGSRPHTTDECTSQFSLGERVLLTRYTRRIPPVLVDIFFSERVINAWNGLPTAVDFMTLAAFKRTLSNANLSPYLKRY